jgi:hypothetical protein
MPFWDVSYKEAKYLAKYTTGDCLPPFLPATFLGCEALSPPSPFQPFSL